MEALCEVQSGMVSDGPKKYYISATTEVGLVHYRSIRSSALTRGVQVRFDQGFARLQTQYAADVADLRSEGLGAFYLKLAELASIHPSTSICHQPPHFLKEVRLDFLSPIQRPGTTVNSSTFDS